MGINRTIHFYELLLILLCIAAITVTTLATLSFQVYPQIYYVLGATWTLLLSLLLFGLYRRDIEINTRSSLVRFADLSAVLVLKLRKVTASILESKTQIEIEEKTAKGMRAVLNIAHEYYSSVTGEYCTANVAAIMTPVNGERVCRIIQYDDFVPNVRKEKEIDIPVEKGLFGEIIRRDLKALIVDDYTANKYPIYPVPIIEEGYCISGICTPIKVYDKITGFFNVDSTVPNIFKPNGHEKAATFFAELLGQLMQVAEFKLREIENEKE